MLMSDLTYSTLTCRWSPSLLGNVPEHGCSDGMSNLHCHRRTHLDVVYVHRLPVSSLPRWPLSMPRNVPEHLPASMILCRVHSLPAAVVDEPVSTLYRCIMFRRAADRGSMPKTGCSTQSFLLGWLVTQVNHHYRYRLPAGGTLVSEDLAVRGSSDHHETSRLRWSHSTMTIQIEIRRAVL
ncbi:hypothetical protein NEOLEDRAFT_342028 [Neolentinus lepideus HHB14362 ss-1]|uniref:Uncharacterized protein n=1 Tax=Neolentinus lepideus HHB14362 ss-1 TaxID=1314782 RepID=A0A165M667_9AGAM|nr:hypothetical protein NEOLEDRAFT_342028 [Neolentinus lepideus HHB14362 ss-1]